MKGGEGGVEQKGAVGDGSGGLGQGVELWAESRIDREPGEKSRSYQRQRSRSAVTA